MPDRLIGGRKSIARQSLQLLRSEASEDMDNIELGQTDGKGGDARNDGEAGNKDIREEDVLFDFNNAAQAGSDLDGRGGRDYTQHGIATFEPVSRRERLWMWTSVVLVLLLASISIAISFDWIDWPGDGIGKQ